MPSFTLASHFPATAARVRGAWLDDHAAMTGAPATRDGTRFTAWEGYIRGEYTEIGPTRVAMRWRTQEFPPDAPDSTVTVAFVDDGAGCRVDLVHEGMPDDQVEGYRIGWQKFYFEPMAAFFRG